MDFLVGERSLKRVQEVVRAAGFLVEQRGEILSAWEPGADPAADDPIADFIPAEYNRAQQEALRTATDVSYQRLSIRMVTRPALVALKLLAATSAHAAPLDKMRDVVDLGNVVQSSWSDEGAREARRLVQLSHPGAGAILEKLVDDIRNGRPITV
ncbi:MAG: hypothetical protein EXR72_26545 [Myxococcales bacterium]|nr:hypothetical protein [Myxococcales bacterium]